MSSSSLLKIFLKSSCKSLPLENPKSRVSGLFQTFTTITKVRNKTGVLVAVSIPIFTAQLEKSRESTDLANLRAAKAAAVSAYLSEDKIGSVQLGSAQTADATVYYDAPNGKLVDSAPSTKYGKGTSTKGADSNAQLGYDPAKAAGDYITVTVKADGDVTLSFNQT